MNGLDQADMGENGASNQTTSTVNRRKVLQGLGAVGLSTAFVGLGQAKTKGSEEIPTSTQFWTYNNSDLSVAELIYESNDAGYDTVEPYYIDDESAVATALEETGLQFSSAHVGLGDLQKNFKETIQTYSKFGADALIHPYEGNEAWNSREAIIDWAETVNEMADRVAAEGMEFGYHNHAHEFKKFGDRFGYDIFAEHVNDNVHLQLDVGWVLVGGADPVAVLNRHSDQIKSLHMKDMKVSDDDSDFVEIGEGDVNMEAVANVARDAADIDYLIYEYDGAPNPLESLNYGAEYLEIWNGPRHRNWNSK